MITIRTIITAIKQKNLKNQLKYNFHYWIFDNIVKKNRFFKEKYHNLTREEAWKMQESISTIKDDRVLKIIWSHVPFLE